jgi:DNA-binding transcriptional LysR family regulator
MVALRLSGDLHWSVVASPDYLARKGTPATPAGLLRHDTLRYRCACWPPYVPTTSLFLNFPVHTQSQPKLRAFIDTALSRP